MRVLVVNDYPPGPGGGVEVYVSRVVEGLRAAGDEVEVFAGVVAHRGLGKVGDFWDPRARRALAARAREFRPDVVHHHSVFLELSASVLGVPPGVPTVLSVHDPHLLGAVRRPGMPVRDVVDRFVKAPLNRAVVRRRVDLLLGVSAEVVRWLRDARLGPVAELGPLAPEPAAPPRPVETCTDVVFVGRLARDKGAVELVRAFADVAPAHPEARLVIAGDGSERASVMAAAGSLGERVHLLGALGTTEVSRVLGGARVVVLPYQPQHRRQASSLALVEAAMHARPVIAGDAPAMRELAASIDGVDLVAADDRAGLARAIAAALDDPALAARRGAAAAAAARASYAVPVVVGRLRELYRGLVRVA